MQGLGNVKRQSVICGSHVGANPSFPKTLGNNLGASLQKEWEYLGKPLGFCDLLKSPDMHCHFLSSHSLHTCCMPRDSMCMDSQDNTVQSSSHTPGSLHQLTLDTQQQVQQMPNLLAGVQRLLPAHGLIYIRFRAIIHTDTSKQGAYLPDSSK